MAQPIIIDETNFDKYASEIKAFLINKTKEISPAQKPEISWQASGALPLQDFDCIFTHIDIYRKISARGHGGYSLFSIAENELHYENILSFFFIRKCYYYHEQGIREDSICIEDYYGSFDVIERAKRAQFIFFECHGWQQARFQIITSKLTKSQLIQTKAIFDELFGLIKVVPPENDFDFKTRDPLSLFN